MLHQYRLKVKDIYETLRWRRRLAVLFAKARLHRVRLSQTNFIGITGSAGKTTTKDLSHLILSAFYPVTRSRSSFNNFYAVAKTLLATEQKHRFCIMEIGVTKRGALDLSMYLLKLNIGVLTNIEKDHFRAFKGQGIDGIAAEKAKLIANLSADGTAVLNIDDARVKAIGEQCRAQIIWVGRNKDATIRLIEATSHYPEPLTLTVAYQGETFKVPTQLHGTQLSLSVLSALGVAVAAGIPLEKAIPPLAEALPVEGRMQIVDGGEGVTFIREDFKAPLWSLDTSLQFLKEAIATRKIAVIGSVSDFSIDNTTGYKQFARKARQHADIVIFVGQNAYRALRTKKGENDHALQGFATMHETAGYLRKILQPGDLVLLKGSNKVDHLERLVFDRQQPIQCWRERCGLELFCNSCSQLYQESSVSGGSIQLAADPTAVDEAAYSSGAVIPVIVGLGNPGEEYEDTAHNIGYRVIDTLVASYGGTWKTVEEGQSCSIQVNGTTVNLFKPDAYMNLTGPKLQSYLASTGCPPSHCIIVYDDMDIELGKIKYKREGGDAGHRGVKSCLAALGTYVVPRLRFGVRQSESNEKAGAQVLSRFNDATLEQLPQLVEKAIAMIMKTIPVMAADKNDKAQ